MKKNIKKSIFVVCIMTIVAVMAMTLVGCDKTDKKLLSMQNSVSYYCNQMLVAEDSNFYAEFITGGREAALIADGEVGEMKDYCILSVTPLEIDMTNRSISFKITGDKGVYEGGLERSILGINFNANISDAQNLGVVKNLTLIVGEETFEYEFASITEEPLDYKKVVENIYNKCAEDLEQMFDGNHFEREVYIKISCDKSKQPKAYYWFVNIVEDSDSMFSVLMDIKTGEIVAKKHK